MNYFLNFAKHRDVQKIITRSAASNQVQGVVLEVDPFWMQLWKIRDKYGKDTVDRFLQHFRRKEEFYDSRSFPFIDLKNFFPGVSDAPYFKHLEEKDLDWKPDIYEYYLNSIGVKKDKSPIVIKICLYPSMAGNNDRVPDLGDNNLRIQFETRPVARLTANKKKYRPVKGGISIGSGADIHGTIGGILKNDKTQYGVSCAHIFSINDSIDQPAYYDSSQYDRVGIVKYKSNLLQSIHKKSGKQLTDLSNINDVDIALIELDPLIASQFEVHKIGIVNGFTKIEDLDQGQVVEFTGRKSGHRVLELGGFAVFYRVKDYGGNGFCFRNLIELKNSGFISSLMKSPVKGSDSGSWVCNSVGESYDWCGSIIGGDRFTGFMVPSEHSMNWINDISKLNLGFK